MRVCVRVCEGEGGGGGEGVYERGTYTTVKSQSKFSG